MKVKFLRLWRGNPIGSIRDWQRGAANLLVSRGICEELKPEVKKAKPRVKKNGSNKRNSK